MKNDQDIRIELGRRLRQLRKELGLTQEEFADRASINSKSYSQIERGTRNITLLNLYRIAMGFDVTLGDLFRFSTEKPLTEEGEEVVVLVTRLLQKGSRRKIRQVLVILRELVGK